MTLRDRIQRVVLLGILALPFFVVLDVSTVWDSNEAFYVQTPREMLQRGDWVVPYFNGQPRLNKPPLSYWLVAALYRYFGVSLFWERLLLAALGFGAVLLVFRIGKRLYEDDGVALLAAGILATTFRHLMLSRRLLIDILLLFWLLGFLMFYLDWRKSRSSFHLIGAALCLGLAFLSKGPVALLAVAVPALLLLRDKLSERRRLVPGSARILRAPGEKGVPPEDRAGDHIGPEPLFPRGTRDAWAPSRPRLSLRGLIAPVLIFGAIASSWYLALGLKLGWKPVIDFFLRENVGRFSGLDYGPARGPFYYVGVFLVDFFPWSIFFLAALVALLIELKARGKHALPGREEAPLLIWMAVFFVVFSLSRNKQEYYILPVYPVAALWLAGRLRRWTPPRPVAVAAAAVFLAAAVGIYLVAIRIFPSGDVLWLPVPLALLTAWSMGVRRLQFATLALASFYAMGFLTYLPPFELYKPIAGFAQTIDNRPQEPGRRNFEAGYFKMAAPSLVFYLDRPIFETYSLDAALERLRSDKMVFMAVEAEDYLALAAALGRPPQIVDARPKLYTTARIIQEGFKRGRNRSNPWARPVYLITNEGIGRRSAGTVHRRSGI